MAAETCDPPLIDFPEPFNCIDVFADRQVALGHGERTALIGIDGHFSYGRLAQEIARHGQALRELGIAPGERVAFVLPDCPLFVFLFLGAIRAGIIPVPMSTALAAPDFSAIIDDCQCTAVIYDPAFAEAIETALAGMAARPRLCLLREILAESAAEITAWADRHPTRATDDCFILYSSGTTGRPKGVVHSHSCLPVISRLFAEHMIGPSEGDVFLSMPRLFTSFGMGIGMAIPLWLGAPVIVDGRRPAPEVAAALFRSFRPTIFAAVPTFYSQLIASGSLQRQDTASLRFCFSGGEAMPAELLRRWIALSGVPVREMIGSTEAGFVYIGNRLDDIRPGTSGKPIPGFRLRIVDTDGHPCPDDTPGRLLVRGQSVMRRYWNDPERTGRALVDGWLDSGDIYRRDSDGFYTYSGRNDDMLKVGGRWLSPFEIESALVEHPKVLEAAVVGRPDAEGLIKAEAWVVLKDQRHLCDAALSDAIADELREHCKSRLAPFKSPRRIHFVEDLPKTAAGKVQRFKLRQ